MNTSIGILDYVTHTDNQNTKHVRSTTSLSVKTPKTLKFKTLKSKSDNKQKMGRAFVIVKYDGENYSAHSITQSIDTAEVDAEQLTRENNHKKHGYSAIPIHIPGTIPITYLKLQTPIYYNKTPYYVTMRSTYGGDTEFRAIALWKTEKEAMLFADISKSMQNPQFIYTYIGGPLET